MIKREDSIQMGILVPQILSMRKNLALHSQFQNGCNFIVDNQLLFIGTNEKGITPFGIHFPIDKFKQIYPTILKGDIEVVQNTKNLSLLFEKLTIDLSPANIYDKKLVKMPLYSYHYLELVIDFLNGYLNQTGISFVQEKFWNKIPAWLDSPILEKDFLHREINLFIHQLIGNGPGLTPSGDDFLVGVMAVDQINPFLPNDFYQIISEEVTKDTTTIVSQNYLAAATKGHFHSFIIEFLLSLKSQNSSAYCLELTSLGHTSGIDTLCGINWAFRQILQKTIVDRS